MRKKNLIDMWYGDKFISKKYNADVFFYPYAAAWRATRAMGYKKLITYILNNEKGVSLNAGGWKCVGEVGGLRWTGKRKPEVDLYPAQMKLRFEIQ